MNQMGETVTDERTHLAVQRVADLIANAEDLLMRFAHHARLTAGSILRHCP